MINIPSVNAGATITFDRPLDLAGKDFTLEWVSFNANNPTGYASEFALLASDNRYSGINVRYGDSGFGNRLQYGTDLSKLEHVYSANVTKSALSGKTSYHALVCRDGSIYVYLNGQRQNLATGTSSVYNKPSFPVRGGLSALRHIRLGWIDHTQPAMIGRVGRIRISEGARYLESYDPVAL